MLVETFAKVRLNNNSDDGKIGRGITDLENDTKDFLNIPFAKTKDQVCYTMVYINQGRMIQNQETTDQ